MAAKSIFSNPQIVILNTMEIVLLGSIPKGDNVRKGWTDWKVDYMEAIKKVLPEIIKAHNKKDEDCRYGSSVLPGYRFYPLNRHVKKHYNGG